MKYIILTLLFLIPLFLPSAEAAPQLIHGIMFNDTFSRADSTTLGLGWIEDETASEDIEIISQEVNLDATNESFLPVLVHETNQQFDGIIAWEFTIDLIKFTETDYQVYMQLGDRDAFDDPSFDLHNEVFVSLAWGGTGGGFATEDMTFGYFDDTGAFEELIMVNGTVTVVVFADLDTEEYILKIESEDEDSETESLRTWEHIPFRNPMGTDNLSAMRIVLNSVNTDVILDNITLNDITLDNKLKNIMMFNNTYPSGVAQHDILLPTPLTNISKAVAFLMFAHESADSHDTMKSWEILNTTHLRIHGGQDTPGSVDGVNFTAAIFEFTNDDDPEKPSVIHVFHETESIPASEPEGIFTFQTPTNFKGDETVTLFSGHAEEGSDGTLGAEELARVRTEPSSGFHNDFQYEVGDTPNTPRTMKFQVVYWDDDNIILITGDGSLTDPSDLEDTITPTSQFNRPFFTDDSLLFVTFMTDNGFTADPSQNTISAHFDSSGDLVIERYDSSTDTLDYFWQIVQFPSGAVNIQHGTFTMADGVTSTTVNINSVNTTQSAVVGTVGTPMGWGFCRADTTTGGAFDRATVKMFIKDSTSFGAERMDGTGEITCGYQVIELIGFPEPEDVTAFDPHEGSRQKQVSCCFFFILPEIIEFFENSFNKLLLALGVIK